MSKSEPVLGALFFIPFAFGPLFLSLFLAFISPSSWCQIILTIGSILYAGWFFTVFLDAFYWHPDAQSPIALLFIGIYSLPVMIPIWIVSLVIRHRNKIISEQDASSNH
jgi:hypothetical protein